MIGNLFEMACEKHPSIEEMIGGRKVVVYGDGNYYQYLKTYVLDPRHIAVEAVLDKKHGLPASRPSAKDEVAIISVSDLQERGPIVEYLSGLGFQRIVGVDEIYEVNLTPAAQERCGRPGFYDDHRAEIEKAFALLEDEESRQVFRAVLMTHLQRSPRPIPHRPLCEQYFPRCGVPLVKGCGRLIVCGAFDGDTVRAACDTIGRMEAVACFEPDLGNFKKLAEFCEARIPARTTALFPCAVSDTTEAKRFHADMGKSSRLEDNGAGVVQCVTIDHALPDFYPTRITMDIEGAEPAALRGAENTLFASVPDLAICVYHEPEHLWEIPLQLARLNLGYRFWLRNYTGAVVETVLYAAEG